MANPQFMAQLRLKHAADRFVIKLGLNMPPACVHQVEQMIHNGITRMQIMGVIDKEPQLRLAEDNLLRCLREMGDEAVEMRTFPQIEDMAFHVIYKKLCPLWPYC